MAKTAEAIECTNRIGMLDSSLSRTKTSAISIPSVVPNTTIRGAALVPVVDRRPKGVLSAKLLCAWDGDLPPTAVPIKIPEVLGLQG